MASKRDLVEAHDFNRRRLVTAFLSGAPGGREVEPVRHGRTIIGGLVLAVLLVAGAAVAGVLKPAAGDDWKSNGMVIGQDSGSRFLMIDGTLYPVANITSARLRFEDLAINYVPDDVLVDVPKGPAIGIVNAPDFLPRARDLVQDGWVACTNATGGLTTTIADDLSVTRAGGAMLAQSITDRSYWILSGGRRYALPTGSVSVDILRSLGLDRSTPVQVSNDWLGLVANGSAVEPFEVPGAGQQSDEGTGELSVIGTPVSTNDQGYVLVADGLVPLDDFAYRVYRGSPEGSRYTEQTYQANELNGIPTRAAEDLSPTDWPTDVGTPVTDAQPCLRLTAGDTSGATALAVLSTTDQAELRAEGTDARVRVAQGHGSVVYATTRATGSANDTTYLIDPRGTRYAIVPKENTAASLDRLGYGSVDPVAVPQAWADLLAEGPDIGPFLSNEVIG